MDDKSNEHNVYRSIRLLTGIFKMRELGILIVFLLLCALTTLLNTRFLSLTNLQSLSYRIAIFAIIAIGETLVIITGGIDLAPGSITALTCMLCAWFLKHNLGIAGSIALTVIIAGLIGLYHGIFVTKLSVPAFVITLGTFLMARSAAGVVTSGRPIINLPESFEFIAWGEILNIVPCPVLILILVAVLAWVLLRFTITGRHIYAIGGNPEAARLSGINVHAKQMLVYVISAALSGVAGIITASRVTQGQVNVGRYYELLAIAGAVIGGASLFGGEGTILGTLIGASILGVLDNVVSIFWPISAYWKDFVIGGVLVIAVTMDIQRRTGKIDAIKKMIIGKVPKKG